MIDKTIIGLIKVAITWLIYPIIPTILKSFRKKMLTPLTLMLTLAYRDFLINPFLHIYPQNLKKKGYDNDKDQSK
jgi:hypothetical protein